MDASAFLVGDVVALRGSPEQMCVEAVSEDGISCVWMRNGVVGRDVFLPSLLGNDRLLSAQRDEFVRLAKQRMKEEFKSSNNGWKADQSACSGWYR